MREQWLRLAHCGLHPDRVRALLQRWRNPRGVLAAVRRGEVATSSRLATVLDRAIADIEEDLATLGIDFVIRGHTGYPHQLMRFPDAPSWLFVRGDLPSGKAVAVVGTRRCTSYGRRVAEEYGGALAAAGWPLVSGLARGIDGAAHRGTVIGEGVGVAVLGCGIDIDYPREHRDLKRRLLELGGGIVSEYPPGTPPEGWRFPPRNRILSGLADAVVVVEAAVTGGALITAGIAADQGIPVLATPGDVERATSWGANLLIRDGALPVLDGSDLIEELALMLGPPPAAMPAGPPASFEPMVDLPG